VERQAVLPIAAVRQAGSVWTNPRKRNWMTGAKALRGYLDEGPACAAPCVGCPQPCAMTARVPEIDVIGHSHGGNLWAYAAGAEHVRFRHVVLIGTPLRADVAREGLYDRAIANSRAVLHVTDPAHDAMQRRGRFGDGKVGQIATPAGMQRLTVEGMGHSGMLYEPERFTGAIMTIAMFLHTGRVAGTPAPMI
jgi:hypothetical protein